jgi:heptosyltransferase-2
MLDRIIYWLALGVITVIRRLPLAVCFALGQLIGVVLWAILPGYRKLARENLTIAFGGQGSATPVDWHKTPAEIRRLTFQHFVTLGANAVCAFKMTALSREDILRVAPIENLDRIKRNIAKGKGVVLAINHIGNWELYAQLVFQVPEARFGTVYQALRNKDLDRLINGDRGKQGVATFDRKRGFNGAIALLREPGIVGVLVDQSAGDGGTWMPFFNRLASTSPLAAALAIRTESVVVPVAIYTTGFAKWRVVLRDEIPYDPANPEALTHDINTVLAEQIRESPADWFWVHNRWKTPLPNFLTVSQKRGTYLPPGCDPAKLQPFRMLIRSPNWLGDAVMSIPTARAFKLGRPDARLAILAPAKLAPLWKTVAEVDEVIPFEAKESIFSVARKIRGRFEVAILFPNSLRSALEVRLAGIPRRVGYRGHHRERLLNQIVSEPKKKKAAKPVHHADRYWRIADRCGALEPPSREPAPPRPVSGELRIAVCPGAEYGPAKRWPTERFREAMTLVSKQVSCTWVIVGTAADSPLATEILQGFEGRAEDLTGRTSLDELITTLRSCAALLTNDTGTMHLADWLEVPLVAVFGSTEPRLTGPRAPHSTVLRHQVECSPCFLRDCPLDFRCMKAVTPAEAAEAVLQLLPGAPKLTPVP